MKRSDTNAPVFCTSPRAHQYRKPQEIAKRFSAVLGRALQLPCNSVSHPLFRVVKP